VVAELTTNEIDDSSRVGPLNISRSLRDFLPLRATRSLAELPMVRSSKRHRIVVDPAGDILPRLPRITPARFESEFP
jgi:hypothetical protein